MTSERRGFVINKMNIEKIVLKKKELWILLITVFVVSLISVLMFTRTLVRLDGWRFPLIMTGYSLWMFGLGLVVAKRIMEFENGKN